MKVKIDCDKRLKQRGGAEYEGGPFVRENETYWSGWWFANIAERDRFLRWYESRKS